jgi:16S rRNA (uracil1498-N3)-methyltransferase
VSGFRPRFFVGRESLSSSPGSPRDPGRDWGVGAGTAPGAEPGTAPGADLGADLSGRELTLGVEDSHHALRVLRLQQGDECEVVVGAAVYAASVSGVAAGGAAFASGGATERRADDLVRVRLTRRLEGPAAGAAYQAQVGVVQSLARPVLIEQVLEKGTEVGASFFVLVPAANSPRGSESAGAERLARWCRIVLEAAKQSKQVAVPPVEFMDSVECAVADLTRRGMLSLVLDPCASIGLEERLVSRAAPGAHVALWIGPESGWNAAESEQFEAAGMEAVRLGRGILRTETAGPVAVAVARLAMRDW